MSGRPATPTIGGVQRKERAMSIFKIHRYGVRTERLDERLLTLEAPGRPTLHIATPSDFQNGVSDVWSPEELLIGSLAGCYELTLIAIAERKDVPLHDIRVDATGHVEWKDGRYRFILFELDVRLDTDGAHVHELEHVAELASERCIVSFALDVPVHVATRVGSAQEAVAV
jgi:organic hydroperoxide reductase OsmC/OhrA